MIEKTHLEIYEILDRFELLYPENQDIADFRRSYIDRDLSSIFRFLTKFGTIASDIEVDTIRSAVIEQNLYDIFRIVKEEDFRKVVLEDNYWSLWKMLYGIQPTHLVSAFKNFYGNDTMFATDCFSRGQIESKKWLVSTLEQLDVKLGTTFLCAGWYATLATLIFESGIDVDKIRSFDIDPSTVDIAKVFNKPWVMNDWKFQAAVDDIHKIDFDYHTFTVHRADGSSAELTEKPNTVINTSCEHIENFGEWYAKIPSGTLVILQTNNYTEVKEHVNCSKTLNAFKKQTPLTTELYSGELLLPKYKRFMRIGYK